MATKSVVLFGTLVGGILGPGGETTGFELAIGDMDVDTSGVTNAPEFSGRPCIVAGHFEERTFPLRGRVRILVARELAAGASGLSRTGLRSSVFLSGTLQTGVLRPGGEGPGSELTGIAPELDVSAVKTNGLVGKVVVATGQFELVRYVTRGLVFVFKAAALTAVAPTPSFSARVTGPDATAARVQAEGISATFSLEEAILDAVRQLPMSSVPADWLTQVHVDSIDAEFGGFAGVSLLKVSISAALPKVVAASFDR